MFSSSRTRTGDHALACEFESGDRLLACDRRELLQEFIQSVSALEIVEQRLHRHPRPDEDWSRLSLRSTRFAGFGLDTVCAQARLALVPAVDHGALPSGRYFSIVSISRRPSTTKSWGPRCTITRKPTRTCSCASVLRGSESSTTQSSTLDSVSGRHHLPSLKNDFRRQKRHAPAQPD